MLEKGYKAGYQGQSDSMRSKAEKLMGEMGKTTLKQKASKSAADYDTPRPYKKGGSVTPGPYSLKTEKYSNMKGSNAEESMASRDSYPMPKVMKAKNYATGGRVMMDPQKMSEVPLSPMKKGGKAKDCYKEGGMVKKKLMDHMR